MILDKIKKKSVLILGFGREGQDTFLFLRKKFPKKILGVADKLPFENLSPDAKKLLYSNSYDRRKESIKMHLGKNYLNALKNYDVIIKSPGISPYLIAPFITKKQRITSQTEIFFENCEGTIIGVTGTKGKSTTASLCYAVLKRAGLKAHLVGNIGKPALQFLETTGPDDIFVYELSSFQLTNMKQSPHIAVFLNLYPEHLDYYQGSFQAYANAKANITTHQTPTDFLIYNENDPVVAKIARQSKAQKIPFNPVRNRISDRQDFVASVEPAILIGKLFGIPENKLQQAIKNFKPLPHRLERVGEYEKIIFYNDSLATIPQATIQAINLLGPKLHTLIAGGFDRGVSFDKLGKHIEKSSIKTLILFPTTGEKILKSIKEKPQYFFVKNMKEAVELCFRETPKGSICLLSPASSSFNMFKDYKDRGDQFKKFIMNHGKKK